LVNRAEKQSKLDEIIQDIDATLNRIKQDEETKIIFERYTKVLETLKRYIDYKEKETQRMIDSVKKFMRAVGAVKQTPQFTQFTQFSDEEDNL
jgi:hypothetical protein